MSKEFDDFMKTVGKMTEEEWQAAERAQTSSQTKISDEEIEKELNKRFAGNIPDAVIYKNCFRMGAKWYREQLRIKNEKK